MKNKKIPMFVLGALLLGAGGSIAVQTFAQTSTPVQSSIVVSNQPEQTVDQKDAQGNDLETNDDREDVVSANVLAQVKITDTQARQADKEDMDGENKHVDKKDAKGNDIEENDGLDENN